jgi:hypothetical protein
LWYGRKSETLKLINGMLALPPRGHPGWTNSGFAGKSNIYTICGRFWRLVPFKTVQKPSASSRFSVGRGGHHNPGIDPLGWLVFEGKMSPGERVG